MGSRRGFILPRGRLLRRRLLREPCSKLTLNLTLTLIGGSFENLAQSHQLVQGLVAPLLAAGRLEDATEVLVTSTHLGVPLGDVGTMSALLDISESLMESGTPLVAINMIDRAELGSFASSEVLTGVANHFLKLFLNNGRIRDVRTVALMMQRKGISGDDETAKILADAAKLGGGGSDGGSGQERGGQREGGSSSWKMILAAFLVASSAGEQNPLH